MAPTQDKATSIAGYSRVCVLHNSYPGQLATAGNFALPLTPLESPIGPVFKFGIYHLMDVEEERSSLFPTKLLEVGPAYGAPVVNGDSGASFEPLKAVQLGPIGMDFFRCQN